MSAHMTFAASDCAAQAGAAIAENCIRSMREATDEAARANLLASALIGLATLNHPEHAAAGFAGALIGVLDLPMQKRIRYAKTGDTCPICNADTVFLNVGPDHFEVCHSCKKQLHFGENLHSGWRDEPMEVWHKNAELLKSYSDFDLPNLPPAPAVDSDLPF